MDCHAWDTYNVAFFFFLKATTMINDEIECCVIARVVFNCLFLLIREKIAWNQPFLVDIPVRVNQVRGLHGD